MQTTISMVRAIEADKSLTASPPSATGLSKELAIVAPSGRVRTKAAQNSMVRDVVVKKYMAATTVSATAITSALPW